MTKSWPVTALQLAGGDQPFPIMHFAQPVRQGPKPLEMLDFDFMFSSGSNSL